MEAYFINKVYETTNYCLLLTSWDVYIVYEFALKLFLSIKSFELNELYACGTNFIQVKHEPWKNMNPVMSNKNENEIEVKNKVVKSSLKFKAFSSLLKCT